MEVNGVYPDLKPDSDSGRATKAVEMLDRQVTVATPCLLGENRRL